MVISTETLKTLDRIFEMADRTPSPFSGFENGLRDRSTKSFMAEVIAAGAKEGLDVKPIFVEDSREELQTKMNCLVPLEKARDYELAGIPDDSDARVYMVKKEGEFYAFEARRVSLGGLE